MDKGSKVLAKEDSRGNMMMTAPGEPKKTMVQWSPKMGKGTTALGYRRTGANTAGLPAHRDNPMETTDMDRGGISTRPNIPAMAHAVFQPAVGAEMPTPAVEMAGVDPTPEEVISRLLVLEIAEELQDRTIVVVMQVARVEVATLAVDPEAATRVLMITGQDMEDLMDQETTA